MARRKKKLETNKELPESVQKFWRQRYNLFSLYDEGIKLNEELWYSVTPENIAKFIARFVKCCLPEASIGLDVFSGAGGNTIQFAKEFDFCYGLDNNKDNVKCATNNAQVYNVEQKCEFIVQDWTKDSYKSFTDTEIDFVHGSPPWGGVDYASVELFDLMSLRPLPLPDLLDSMKNISDHIVLFLPKNANLEHVSEATKQVFGKDAKVRVTQALVDKRLKGLLCFWGEKFMVDNNDN